MSNICRLCLQIFHTSEFFNVFQNTDEYPDFPSLADFLYWVFGVAIHVDDPYSKLICKECIKTIQYVQAFRKLFATNQQILECQNISAKYKLSEEQHRIVTTTPHYTRTTCIPLLELVKLEDEKYSEDSNNRHRVIRTISILSNTSTEGKTEVRNTSILSPRVEIPRLETIIRGKYEKIDYFRYKKISVSDKQKCSNRKERFIEYYYKKPTTALQELIADHKTKAITQKGKSSRSPTSLLEVKNVVDLQMCKICDQVFEKKTLLNMHQEIMHKNTFKPQKNIKRKYRKWELWKIAKNKKSLHKLSSPGLICSSSSAVEVNSNKMKIQREGFKNIVITEETRPLIGKALDDMRNIESSDKKVISTNETQLNNQSNSCIINGTKMELTNSIPKIPNKINAKNESSHNLQLKNVNETEMVGVDKGKIINSVIIGSCEKNVKLNNIEPFSVSNNTRKSEGTIINDGEKKMDNCDTTKEKQNNGIVNLRFNKALKYPGKKRKIVDNNAIDFFHEKRVAIRKTKADMEIMKILRNALEKNITDSCEFLQNLNNYEIVKYF